MVKNIVLYSKTLKTVAEFSLANSAELLTLGLGLNRINELKSADRTMIIDQVIDDCSKIGQYISDYERGVGLHKYKDKLYYNSGNNLFDLSEKMKKKSYNEIVRDDFLVSSRVAKIKNIEKARPADFKLLRRAFKNCGWAEEFYGDILIGFLVQSVYAGSSDFSPHLWLQSNKPKTGKSWISDWLTDNIFLDSPKCDGSGSTVKGFRQSLRFFSGLAFIDEFAEKGHINKNDTKFILKTLRAGVTGKSPITLGTKQQVPIQIKIKFSALLSCIHGKTDLEPQDDERIIFLMLIRKDSADFLKSHIKLFEEYAENNTAEGFLKGVLQHYKSFDALYEHFLIDLTERCPELGHKSRGFAAVLAGFSIIFGKKEGNLLKEKIIESDISNPMNPDCYQEDTFESMLDTIISRNDTGMNRDLPLYKVIENGLLVDYGIKLSQDKTEIKLNYTIFKPLFNKYYKGTNIGVFMKALKMSKHFKKDIFCKHKGRSYRGLSFKTGGYYDTGKSEENNDF